MEERTGDQPFAPDWVSPPGDTIKDLQQENNISDAQLGAILGFTPALVQDLLSGELRMYYDLAKQLTKHLGGSVDFWLTRDHQYRQDKKRVVNTTKEEAWQEKAIGHKHTRE